MNLKIKSNDPLNILTSTKYVLEKADDVEIDVSKITDLVRPIKARLKEGIEESNLAVGSLGEYTKELQLILVEDVVNFCFWAEKGKEKWQIEWPKGNIVKGGWYCLEACFNRALKEGKPILSAKYLSSISLKDVKNLFRSSNIVEIPLIGNRQKNLIEAGSVLSKKYDGKFINFLEASSYDAVKIVKNLYRDFSSFKDISKYKNREVYFLKRAQLVPNDVSFVSKNSQKLKVKNLDKLAAFADYKVPQILRNFGILRYSKKLSERVDNYELIPAGSKEETEIRAGTVWGVELIRQSLNGYTSAQIDNAIWLISQDQSKVEKPYHRTYTIYY